jgi:hypothetical protein
MNKAIRNFKLLYEDITYPFLKYYQTKQNEKVQWKIDNTREVLHLYRHMLINIPKFHKSLFEKRFSIEEIKFHFREGSRETDPVLICKLKNTCYVIIEKINKGVYPPFPKYK